MSLQLLSDVIFGLGRRAPRLPCALLRAMPLGLLHALRAPGLRETFRVAARASYYRDAFAAARVDVARARRPERSEERRVGKECRSRWSPCQARKTGRHSDGELGA